MNRRDKMHPNKARCDSPEMRLAFLDRERVVAPRRAIRWPPARNDHLDALREVADSGRYVNRPVVTGMGLPKALLATKHEPEGMGQITWSLSKSERVFDCAGSDSDNGETIATDGQVKAFANRGYTRPPKSYYEHVDFENSHYIDGTCRPWEDGFLKAGRLRNTTGGGHWISVRHHAAF
ncbi:hypothetical protein [Rhizobium laguerreae]|uniref:hypothetical protein n=1 Tax=Rhizobium laguerreae TaxID=1076926 RepID=UPI001C9167C8|nr:hypothetical protein [Rhizobium laguerreae]MBY3447189.1 hypothetical protein [Rhizobium laguerreae]